MRKNFVFSVLLIIYCFSFSILFFGCTGDINSDLLYSAEKGDITRVQDLLQRGADVNTKSKNGFTPLIAAAGRGHKGLVEILINKGANVNVHIDHNPYISCH